MKKAIISDIHGNLEALTAVLADIAQQGIPTQNIICLGDVVGYGPDPIACLEIAQTFPVHLLGNHEEALYNQRFPFNTHAQKAIDWTRQQIENLPAKKKRILKVYLSQLPTIYHEGDVTYVHGSPRDHTGEYIMGNMPALDLRRIISHVQHLCFVGHTHLPGLLSESTIGRFPALFGPSEINDHYKVQTEKAIINVGSVGQPRDCIPRACYVCFDGSWVEWRRVSYDTMATYGKISHISELDDRLGIRLLSGN